MKKYECLECHAEIVLRSGKSGKNYLWLCENCGSEWLTKQLENKK